MRTPAPTDYIEIRAIVETLKREGRMTPMQEVRDVARALRIIVELDPRKRLCSIALEEIRASIDRDPAVSTERLWLLVEAFRSNIPDLEPVTYELN